MAGRCFSTQNGPAYVQSPGLLYERQAVTDLWNKLTIVARKQWKWKNVPDKGAPHFVGTDKRLVQVYGPPGTGKTRATFGWLSKVCRKFKSQALWINCMGGCWLVDGANLTPAGYSSVRGHAHPQSAIDAVGCCTVVFDGVRQKFLDARPDLSALMFNIAREGVAVVVVSSEGVRLPDGESNDIDKLLHFVPSWTLEEYNAACSNNDFWNSTHARVFAGSTPGDSQETREAFIKEKFAVAGHSARFMFHRAKFRVEEEIKAAAKALTVESLERAIRGPGAIAGAVNTLVARLQTTKNGPTPVEEAQLPSEQDWNAVGVSQDEFYFSIEESDGADPEPRIVSSFATRVVIKELPSGAEVGRLKSLAQKLSNRALLGYAFEESLQKILKVAAGSGGVLRLKDEDDGVVTYEVGGFRTWDASQVEEKLKTTPLADNTWIFVGGQQGLFNVIHVRSNTHIRFVQATVGKEHSFKLSILAGMMERLGLQNSWNWDYVDFVMLRPDDEKGDKFSIKRPDGGLQPDVKRFDGKAWTRDSTWEQNVNVRYIAWSE